MDWTPSLIVWVIFAFFSSPASGNPTQERVLNPVVLMAGGNIDGFGGGFGQTIDVFIPWESGFCSVDLPDLPDSRSLHTVNAFKGDIIMCGGFYTEDSCLVFDENQQRFVPHSKLIGPRYSHAGAVVNNSLLLVGGDSNFVELWNGTQWIKQESNLADIQDLRYGSCIATISEDTILMAGGLFHGGKFTNKMLKYRDGVWERMEDFPGPPRSDHGCAFIHTPEGDAFLIAGGVDDGWSKLDSSYLYNIEKRQWEEVGNLEVPRKQGKVLVLDEMVVMLGGRAGSGRPLDVEEYDVETKIWTTIPQKIKRGRNYFDAVVVPGALVGC